MLKSVLSAIPAYTMSCFKLPKSLIKRIQSALTRFWWDAKPGKKKMCWIAWSKLTRSKHDGGLGFRYVESFNDALLAKLSWRILTNPQCLLARVLKGRYCPTTPFLQATTPSSSSHGWRSIMIGKDLLLTNVGKSIGNGKNTMIWTDPWLSGSKPIRPVGPPPQHTENMRVSELLKPNSSEWDRGKIATIVPQYASDILCIKPSTKGAENSFIWTMNKTGVYSTKSGYHASVSSKYHNEGCLEDAQIN